MGKKAKVKVKVKKRKLKLKRVIFCLLFLGLLGFIFSLVWNMPILNIYIIGNDIVSDKEIIDMADISDYPSFIRTSDKDIIRELENNDFIDKAEVEKKLFGKLYIYITEHRVISLYNNKLLLSSGKIVDNIYDLYDMPILISDISSVKDKYVKAFSKVDDEILLKISEIEYAPNEVDKERFILYMNDENLVYITLGKIIKINKYNSIYSELDGKKGIIYLDSGDYVEVKGE